MVPLHCQPVDVQVAVLAVPQVIEEALATLTPRERFVLRAYYGLSPFELPRTLEYIGKQLSLSRAHVGQIKNKAIRRLRHASRSERLRSYADVLFSFCAGDEI